MHIDITIKGLHHMSLEVGRITGIVVDKELSSTSRNPVENRAITKFLKNKGVFGIIVPLNLTTGEEARQIYADVEAAFPGVRVVVSDEEDVSYPASVQYDEEDILHIYAELAPQDDEESDSIKYPHIHISITNEGEVVVETLEDDIPDRIKALSKVSALTWVGVRSTHNLVLTYGREKIDIEVQSSPFGCQEVLNNKGECLTIPVEMLQSVSSLAVNAALVYNIEEQSVQTVLLSPNKIFDSSKYIVLAQTSYNAAMSRTEIVGGVWANAPINPEYSDYAVVPISNNPMIIEHGMGGHPAVIVLDEDECVVEASVSYPDEKSARVEWNGKIFNGTIILRR